MSPNSNPNDDQRTTAELVAVALTETDEEIAWDAVRALHWRGGLDVLEHANQLTKSNCSRERRLGADLIGQLGIPDRTNPEQCKSILRGMLTADENAEVLRAVLVAISHQNDIDAIPLVIGFSTHPDSTVRHGVVLALSIHNGHEVPQAIETLIKLSNDSCEHVRDWATFGLGTQIEIDTQQIRDALADRLNDPDFDTRGEALVGLAKRNDLRAIAALKLELESDCIGCLAIEAAELIASNELYPLLVDLRGWWDIDIDLLERAIEASKN
ncbi:MAG: HEAT repeat domain-containing protein [Pirellula sp.]|nr:HEAT repeat domain-containing protein [Pirellula sp.]